MIAARCNLDHNQAVLEVPLWIALLLPFRFPTLELR